ncbi:UNVERIFIED_CONTAM: hypothetical protein Sangu_3015500 [Sesamum angustifolium]|uniref:DDE Tnp4 domain-containing protein n=1 Tax=Sesamum angustifolium TaxID=2727405 RepID=A0AAW2KNZ7_9LAMI
MNESSGNTTSSPPCRSNSPHDTGLSWAAGSSGRDEETDSSNRSSDEEKHFMLLYEVFCASYFRTKQPQHTSSLQGSDWDCVGAIDGTLIPASVPVHLRNAYRSWHRRISQNVTAICDFDLIFTYVMVGWEGRANDARVFMDCLNNDTKFPWPPDGKYYLVHSAYPNFLGFLASYRQDRYHINSFRGPMPQYSLHREWHLVIACCVIHNFIQNFSIDDQFFERGELGEFDNHDNQVADAFHLLPQQSQEHIDVQSVFRDAMAAQL